MFSHGVTESPPLPGMGSRSGLKVIARVMRAAIGGADEPWHSASRRGRRQSLRAMGSGGTERVSGAIGRRCRGRRAGTARPRRCLIRGPRKREAARWRGARSRPQAAAAGSSPWPCPFLCGKVMLTTPAEAVPIGKRFFGQMGGIVRIPGCASIYFLRLRLGGK